MATTETDAAAAGVAPPAPKPQSNEDLFRTAHQRYKRTGPGRADEAVDFSAAATAAATAASSLARRRRQRPSRAPFAECTNSSGEIHGGGHPSLDPRITVVEGDGSPPIDGDGRDGTATETETASSPAPATVYAGPVFGLSTHPGFLFCPGALSPSLRLELARRALGSYCEPPLGGTNIELVPPKRNETTTHDGGEATGMWDLWKEENGFGSSDADSNGTSGNNAPSSSSCDSSEKPPAKRRNRRKAAAPKRDGGKNDIRRYRRLDKLSWSTLGYHYDWTARAYREERRSDVPAELQELGAMFAALSDEYGNVDKKAANGAEGGMGAAVGPPDKTAPGGFRAQAAIVNYYGPKSVMGGHRDDLELDLTRPVVSLSLGLSAIFLLGGKTRDGAPPVVPVLVRAGDVIIMGGESRMCYHGVARVLESGAADVWIGGSGGTVEKEKEPPFRDCCLPAAGLVAGAVKRESIQQVAANGERDECHDERDRAAARAYLLNHRININLRQVLPDGVERIPE